MLPARDRAQRKLFLHRAMETNTPIVYQEELSCIQRLQHRPGFGAGGLKGNTCNVLGIAIHVYK